MFSSSNQKDKKRCTGKQKYPLIYSLRSRQKRGMERGARTREKNGGLGG